MALLDYSSDDGSQDDDDDDHTAVGAADAPDKSKSSTEPAKSALPPLPRAFHDLYAATVRAATADHPSLHHGRQRAIPHVAGQWPSHLYIEWVPDPREYERLGELVSALRDRLEDARDAVPGDSAALHSLLTSDLGVPLPLHISLSRPFVLQTAEKTGFLHRLAASIRAANVGPFGVVFSDLVWYRGPDSARAFLVLRADVAAGRCSTTEEDDAEDNRPLVALLDRCNMNVAAAGQPTLYAGSANTDTASSSASSSASSPASKSASKSFHVSVAWTLASDIGAWADATREVYQQWKTAGIDSSSSSSRRRRRSSTDNALRIHVESIKAKIGNVVTDIPLAKVPGPSAARPGVKMARKIDDCSDDCSDGTESTSNKKSKTGSDTRRIGNDTRRRGKSLFGL